MDFWTQDFLRVAIVPTLESSVSHTNTFNMVVRIRLARFGKRNAPVYNIVVANARYVLHAEVLSNNLCTRELIKKLTWLCRTARNSKPMEVIGTYNPIPQPDPDGERRPFKDIKLDISRAKYWLGVGAQPSDPAWKLLSMVRQIPQGSLNSK
jgi:small subunit ribosomal protein S16